MTIFLTKKGESDFISIKNFILNKWGNIVAEAFEQKVNNLLDVLEQFPELGQVEVVAKEIRGFQLTK